MNARGSVNLDDKLMSFNFVVYTVPELITNWCINDATVYQKGKRTMFILISIVLCFITEEGNYYDSQNELL